MKSRATWAVDEEWNRTDGVTRSAQRMSCEFCMWNSRLFLISLKVWLTNFTNPRVQSQHSFRWCSAAWVKSLVKHKTKRHDRREVKIVSKRQAREERMRVDEREWAELWVIVSYANFNELKNSRQDDDESAAEVEIRNSIQLQETIFLSSGSSMQFILIQEIKKMLISPSSSPVPSGGECVSKSQKSISFPWVFLIVSTTQRSKVSKARS